MGTITTLRPSGTTSGTGWTPSAGMLHGVTSDNSDATYATWSGSGSSMVLVTPLDSPPAGERRHQVRLRARGEDGTAWGGVQTPGGLLLASMSAPFTASPTTVTGSWGFGVQPDGPQVLSASVSGQSTGLRITELYIDVDSREAPTFTPQVLNGAGSVITTVADTAQPTLRVNAVDTDGLTLRLYRYWVTLDGAIVWDTGIVSGAATNRQTTALDNGAYVAHYQIWTTLGQNDPYPSDEYTLDFTVQVGLVAQPDNPTVTPVPDSPFYELEACAPFVDDLDGGQGWIQLQRVDCPVGGYLVLPGSAGAHASAPDPGPALTDLQVTFHGQRDDGWRPADDETMVSHYDTDTGPNRSWRFMLDADGGGDPALGGRPSLTWSADGSATVITAGATARLPIDAYGRAWARATLDVNDGAGGWAVTFETRDTEDGPWVQLGDVVTNSGGGTTALFDSTTAYRVGGWLSTVNFIANRFTGRAYWAEVRNGAAGQIIVSPDFTSHLDGTTSFEDAQGNTWTVHSPAAIFSPVSTSTIAMLGPLTTGECASWTDFTLPRTGVGLTCDHQPEPCCSYYRARTVGRVDGDLRISIWSDMFDPAIPLGMIVMWPSTVGSIPDGWDRVTALDSRYPKGIATGATEPGTTGGAATHTHTTPGHVHNVSHPHGVTGNTGTVTGTVNSADGAAGTMANLSTHTHTRASVNTTTLDSQSAAPGTSTGSNHPAWLETVFIESDGTPLGVPDGALAIMPDISPAGWTDFADATGRFLKGAAGGFGGGATSASGVNSHTHTIDAHTHAGTSHTHTSPNTGSTGGNRSLLDGAVSVLWQSAHEHPVTVGSATTAALASASGGASGAAGADLRPPFRNVRVKENTSGVLDLPLGLICAWRGALGAIPDNWAICDGTGGTLDLTGRYPQGATSSIGTAGGSAAGHTHTGGSHTHTTSGHSHTTTVGSAATATKLASATATVVVATGTHTHSSSDTDSATPGVGTPSAGTLASSTTEPPFEEVAFVQLTALPEPPPEPDVVCLTWDDGEHLIRTTGPGGPMWAPILGQFEWSVDRPFTATTGVEGTRFVTSAAPGGRNLSMVAAVESESALLNLHAILSRPLVLISPSDATEVWAAPVAESVKIIRIGRTRQITADFIGTGPQPGPQLADVGA